ncbi:MAG TPA: 3-phosphoserine/phosphohydroxythreonine transaminase [Anaerolineales bacterium]|nr:3-phosphoserine/phosphohydroxythreonine transaminase [Anaerolineales bacterium]
MSIKRVYNFNPGPAALPLEVLQQAQAEMLDYKGTGMSVMEISHRSKEFEAIVADAQKDLRELLQIPSNYKILFLQGGASLQFAMVPMNFRPAGASADYIVTGTWSKKAFKESQKLGTAKAAANLEADNFNHLPAQADLKLDPQAAYLHFTSNETIHGVEYFTEPTPPAGVPLICDASSDFISHPIDVSKYAMIYAGAQKNAGPAGVVICIVRDDLLEKVPANLPNLLDYKALAEENSLLNTPPCWSVYIVGLVLKWAKGLGGLQAIEKRNQAKADLVYKAIDESGGYYRGHAKADRSRMNITFRLPSEALEDQFASEAKKVDLIGLKGHRSVGGMRASLYNALPVEASEALVKFMKEFQQKNG